MSRKSRFFFFPALGTDGTIYFGSMDSGLYALYPNGTKKWRAGLGSSWVYSSPVIDSDGIIYAASVGSSRLCAIYPNGTIKWDFYANDWIYCSPAIDENGIIYIGSNDYNMYAIYPNGTMGWKFTTGDVIGSAPTIGDDGKIYFGSADGYLYSLYPNGTLCWRFPTGYIGGSSPAISNDGTIYVGSNNGKIFSIDPNGNENWHFQTNGDIISSPAIDKNGIIYVGSLDGNLYAINPNGSSRWKFSAGDNIESSAAIGEDGTIYIAAQFQPKGRSSYTYLYALEVIEIENEPPSKPIITGPPSGTVGEEYDYTFVSIDPDGDNVSYYIKWGDDTNTGWIGPYESGEEITRAHRWDERGTYQIMAKAKDIFGEESEWGYLEVEMPMESNSQYLKFLGGLPLLKHLFNILF